MQMLIEKPKLSATSEADIMNLDRPKHIRADCGRPFLAEKDSHSRNRSRRGQLADIVVKRQNSGHMRSRLSGYCFFKTMKLSSQLLSSAIWAN